MKKQYDTAEEDSSPF
jgi:hypothetical protein